MRLPNHQQRLLVIGRTGSGKSRAAMWHLSQKNFNTHPWIVLNHKGEEMINSIEGAQYVDLDFVPKKPGLFIYNPMPETDDDAVTALLWKIHARKNCGVYIDEGYMINPRDPALTALYTQGRGLNIPMITLSQRPSKISRFGVSEADFYQVFQLIDKRDRETVNAFIPYSLENLMSAEAGTERLLPDFHSVYYDVSKNKVEIIAPVPNDDFILETLSNKLILSPKKKYLI